MEKHKGNLNRNHGIKLLSFSFNGSEFEIRTTDHTHEHLERKYNLDVICGDIVALGKERLYNYTNQGDDVAIIDQDNDITIIITFEGNQIRIRTVIDKSNVWIRKGTRIYRLNGGGFRE